MRGLLGQPGGGGGGSGSGNQGGATGAVINSLAKATALNTLGDSGILNPSDSILRALPDYDLELRAGVATGAGCDVILQGSDAFAGSGGNGGHVVVIGGAGDGAGFDGGLSFGGVGAGYPWMSRYGSDTVGVFTGDGSALGDLSAARLSFSSGYAETFVSTSSNYVLENVAGTGGLKWYTSSYDLGIMRAAAGRINITNGDAVNYLTLGIDTGTNALIKVPNHASGAGNLLTVAGSDAFAGSGAAGGNIKVLTGDGDGAGTDGIFHVATPTSAHLFKVGNYPGLADFTALWFNKVTSTDGNWNFTAGTISSVDYFQFQADQQWFHTRGPGNSPTVVLKQSGLSLADDYQLNWVNGVGAEGTRDTGLKRSAAGRVAITNGSTGGGALNLPNITIPSPIAGSVLIYAKDVAGTSKLFAMDGAGAETQLTP